MPVDNLSADYRAFAPRLAATPRQQASSVDASRASIPAVGNEKKAAPHKAGATSLF